MYISHYAHIYVLPTITCYILTLYIVYIKDTYIFSCYLLQGYNPSLTPTVLTNCILLMGNFFLSFLNYVKPNKEISFLGNDFLKSNK